MFVGKAGAYPIEEPFRFSTLGQAPGFAHKQYTRLERLVGEKHSSLLQKFVSYGRKKFYNTGPRWRRWQRSSFKIRRKHSSLFVQGEPGSLLLQGNTWKILHLGSPIR